MLVSLLDNERTVASHSLLRGLEYKCPGCRSDVILKAGSKNISHFAHKPDSVCEYGHGETFEHEDVKFSIWEWLNENGHEAQMEVDLSQAGIDRRADILASINGKCVVIEVQHSPIDEQTIDNRTNDYTSVGLPVLWVYVGDKFNTAMPLYFQKVHGGVLFKCEPGDYGLLQPLRLEAKQVYVPYTEFYKKDGHGEMGSAGGYYKYMKNQKKVSRFPDIFLEIDQIDFARMNRNGQLVGYLPYNLRWF